MADYSSSLTEQVVREEIGSYLGSVSRRSGPDADNAAVQRMKPHWNLADVLLQGTEDMQRYGGRKYIAQNKLESDAAYIKRINSSVLYDFHRLAIATLVSRAFTEDVVLQGPDEILALEDDIDREGNTLTDFCKLMMTHNYRYGVSRVMVDMGHH